MYWQKSFDDLGSKVYSFIAISCFDLVIKWRKFPQASVHKKLIKNTTKETQWLMMIIVAVNFATGLGKLLVSPG